MIIWWSRSYHFLITFYLCLSSKNGGGGLARGVPTAHSASPLRNIITSEEAYVWPYAKGTVRGQSIQPLYSSVPSAALRDSELHELLALVDAVRVGRVREQSLALEELKKRLFDGA